jgi:hypothetical protein
VCQPYNDAKYCQPEQFGNRKNSTNSHIKEYSGGHGGKRLLVSCQYITNWRRAAPRLAETGPQAIRIDSLSGNLKLRAPGSAYRSKLNGWKSYQTGGTGVPTTSAAAAMGFSSSLRFSDSANVADPPGFSAGGWLRVVAREVRTVTTSAALGDTGFEGDGALMHVKCHLAIYHCEG